YEFEDIPRFDDNGVEIEYSVEEVEVPGFTSVVSGFDITNTQKTTSVDVKKNWNEVDSDYRPDTITIQVKNGMIIQDTIELDGTEDTAWTYTFTNLPTHDAEGNKIYY